MRLFDLYNERVNTPSDINEHLPTLKKYADDCNHITEMGVRWVVSTFAFMMGAPLRMVSYDIDPVENFNFDRNELKQIAAEVGVDFDFYEANTLELEIEETDLLFLDTDHTYQQVSGELKLHGNKSRKYIIFHDTVSFGEGGFQGDEIGIIKAIEEFLQQNPNWSLFEHYTNNNGLTILKRTW